MLYKTALTGLLYLVYTIPSPSTISQLVVYLGLIYGCLKISNQIVHHQGPDLNLLNIVPRKHAFSSP